MAQTPVRGLDELFRFLLSSEHAPYAFDLVGSTVRLNLVIHISDVFVPSEHAHLVERVRGFVRKADQLDNVLIERYGCRPAQETPTELIKDEHR